MGEYAKFNGREIKIGTCESMYYLRYEDRARVDPVPHSLDPAKVTGLFFRLPYPDEDGQEPGSYKMHNKGYRLGKREELPNGQSYWADWHPEDAADADPGIIQLSHESGLLLNVPCHHGAKLPDVGEHVKAFWNGKSHALELSSVKSMPGGITRPVYHCRWCGSMWSCEWEEILPYCGLDAEMLRRLEGYAALNMATV